MKQLYNERIYRSIGIDVRAAVLSEERISMMIIC